MNSPRRKVGRRSPRKPNAWQSSGQFRLMATAAIIAYNRRRHTLPKCEATAKSTGEPCGNLAMANGKCWVHGGRTPRGDRWHQIVLPKSSAPGAVAKTEAKLAKSQRLRNARDRRLAAMSPAERAAAAKWAKTHRPGRAAARRAERERRRQDHEARRIINRLDAPKELSPEAKAIADRIEVLKSRKAAIEAEALETREDPSGAQPCELDPTFNEGVFG